MTTTLLLAAAAACAFIGIMFLLHWVFAECHPPPLTAVLEHCEAQGPAGFWPRAFKTTPTSDPERCGPTAACLFRRGCPCHLALMAVYGPGLGMNRGEAFETQLALAQRMDLQGMCGAAVSALTLLQAQEDRERTAGAWQEWKPEDDPKRAFIRDFIIHWGSLYCKDILGCDLQTPAGRDKAREQHLYETLCAKVIQDAGTLLGRVGENGHWIERMHRTMHKDVGLAA